MSERKWESNIGFVFAAVGSAVGLGNIWSFPYKMATGGGAIYLVTYVIMTVVVGIPLLVTELAVGRRTQAGPVNAYRALSKRCTYLGVLSVLSPFIVMTYYTVLGAYCLQYFLFNIESIFDNKAFVDGNLIFKSVTENTVQVVFFSAVFLFLCYVILRKGISGGIEKFNVIGMSALLIMLVLIVLYINTLDGAEAGIEYIFTFKEESYSFINIFSSCGEQMFFSLSIAMGSMITYGSYLSGRESLINNSLLIAASDTVIAVLAALAVIPAAFYLKGDSAKLYGPELLFVTLQEVFDSLGAVGALMGSVFFLLVIVAAVSSAVSLIEVPVSVVEYRGDSGRKFVPLIVCILIFIPAVLISLYGMKSVTAVTYFTEGILMPFIALCTVIYFGWIKGCDVILRELKKENRAVNAIFRYLYPPVMKYVAPLVLITIIIEKAAEIL